VVDYAAAEGPIDPAAERAATWRCPTGAIQWVAWRQLAELEPPAAALEWGLPEVAAAGGRGHG
jgi:hypothetical protein